MPHKGILLDLFGTIAFIENDEHEPYKALLKAMGFHEDQVKDLRLIADLKEFKTIQAFADSISPKKFNATPFDLMAARGLRGLSFYPDVERTLTILKQQGFRLGLISCTTSIVSKRFEELPMSKFFDYRLYSWQIGIKKDDERTYAKAIKDMDLDIGKSWMIGDTYKSDVASPKRAGLNAILLTRTEENRHINPHVASLDGFIEYLRFLKVLT
jgi:FMN phosphatase YigB (HAD superfamily)